MCGGVFHVEYSTQKPLFYPSSPSIAFLVEKSFKETQPLASNIPEKKKKSAPCFSKQYV